MGTFARGCAASFGVVIVGVSIAAEAAVTPLTNAHAHNDYLHPRPLLDALAQGFCSVEADVFLIDGKLLVAHTVSELKPERTLETLYLKQLRSRVESNGGKVYANGPAFWLLIDVKSEAKSTYAALHDLLARYEDVLTLIEGERITRKAVSVVISGNMARDVMAKQPRRFAGYDGRSADVDSAVSAPLMPWVSDNWTKLFTWKGNGSMPDQERGKLKDFVRRAHEHGRLTRFWNTPDQPAVWAELRTAGVDLINTDRLQDLRKFLTNP